jgi:predicted RNA-binding protein (TIGR00451 family)
MRPTDGLFSLSIEGAKRIADSMSSVKCSVVIRDDVAEFVIDGGDVFAVHVVGVGDDVRAKDEVVVLDEKGRVLAVGRAVLSAGEMRAFKKGIAVKVRRGCGKEG